MEIAIQVGLQRQVEVLFGQVVDAGRVHLKSGVVDQHVEAAEGLHRPAYGVETEIPVGHVAADQQATAPLFLNRPARLVGVLMLV